MARLWSSLVIAEKLRAGTFGAAYLAQMKAFVLAGLPTTIT